MCGEQCLRFKWRENLAIEWVRSIAERSLRDGLGFEVPPFAGPIAQPCIVNRDLQAREAYAGLEKVADKGVPETVKDVPAPGPAQMQRSPLASGVLPVPD